jgi:hypothetical protein
LKTGGEKIGLLIVDFHVIDYDDAPKTTNAQIQQSGTHDTAIGTSSAINRSTTSDVN